MQDTKYLYAVSRIRVLEDRLISRSTLDRMLEATTPEAAFKILGETDYGNYFGEVERVHDFEKVLESDLKSTYKVVDDSTRDSRFTLLSRIRFDFHNAKVFLKQRYLEEDYSHIVSHLGTVDPAVLKRAVAEENFGELPPFLKIPCEKAITDFKLSKDPQRIDIILDQGLYRVLLDIVKDIGDPDLEELMASEIDLVNINTFLRVKKMGRSPRFLEAVLLEGGSLGKSFFVDAAGEPVSSFMDKLSSTKYEKIAVEGVQSWVDTGSSTLLEKLSDDFLLNMAKKGKYTAFGILPIIGFLKAKENEVKLVRMIMVGKINGISADRLRERLRDVYV